MKNVKNENQMSNTFVYKKWKGLQMLPVDKVTVQMLISAGIRAKTSSAIAVIADRTACSILTLFIVITTSRPLNKKICSLSVRGPTITADRKRTLPQPAHLCCTCSRTVHGTVTARCMSLLTNELCLFDSHASV